MSVHPAHEQTLTIYAQRLTRVLHHIDRHLAGDLSPAALARIAHFSPFHFQRLFRAMIGEPLGDYIRRRRLDRAAHLLRTTRSPIITIADEVGYQSQAALTRAFRARFGTSPARYRRTGGPDFWQTSPVAIQFNQGGHIAPPDDTQNARAMLNITIQQIQPRRIATIRPPEKHGLRAAMAYGTAAGQLLSWALSRNIELRELIVIDYAGRSATTPDHFDMAPAIPLPPDAEPEDWFTILHIGGGPHAVAHFRGKPQALGEAYDWIYGQWFPTSGYEPGDTPGFYLNEMPELTDDIIAAERAAEEQNAQPDIPESLDVQLCIPLRQVALDDAAN